ncbi:BLUF domain-containing protein [Luteirhabdus pelagi]|uniref:BLUF domain-containing protein n=1 Tax=Luteirhabdus pelagi TaxID=2792783 RepID=UPI0019395616|nr:BLUF domain-containing protein [Luteirhabdus pelagi]
MMNHTICYVSKAHDGISAIEIEDIFQTTLKNNQQNNINGILLHGLGHFFQVLEGREKTIQPLFEAIQKDQRHRNIEVLINHRLPKGIFSGYSSKFNVVKTSEELEKIRTYLDINKKESPFSDKVQRVLNPFLIPA